MALWVIAGVAGSGKTSLAKRLAAGLGCACLDADDFHPEANKAKMAAGQPLTEADREPWLDALCAGAAALRGAEAVLAFPALKATHRDRLRAAHPDVRFAWLEITPELAAARLKARGGFFPPELVTSQFAACEPEPEAFQLDASQALETLEAQLLGLGW